MKKLLLTAAALVLGLSFSFGQSTSKTTLKQANAIMAKELSLSATQKTKVEALNNKYQDVVVGKTTDACKTTLYETELKKILDTNQYNLYNKKVKTTLKTTLKTTGTGKTTL